MNTPDGLRAAGVGLLLAAAGYASLPASDLPPMLMAAANERPLMTVSASGHQLYECRASRDAASGYAWAFVAPEAELFDRHGKPIGKHGVGPYWEAADGSRIVGRVKARADANTQGAIPWLLLSTQNVGPRGLFSPVTSVQRINTVGGLPPAGTCGRDNAGVIVRTFYTADYRLYSTHWEPVR